VRPPDAVTVVIYGGKVRLYEGWKKPLVSPLEILTFQNSIDETVSGGGLTVMVLTVPGCINIDVVYAGIVIVVADGNGLGGSTKRHGGMHCAGVPV
jgi:hypothetical protein